VNSKVYAILMIAGLLVSTSTVYLNSVFADDNWSDIVKRQQAAEEKAMLTYASKYQFTDMDQTKRNWSGLTSVTTDETSRGRPIEQQAQVSLENALAQFDQIHVKQLMDLQRNYTGLTNTPTDEQGRSRTVMIADAQNSSDVQANAIISQLRGIQSQTYVGFETGPTTEGYGYDRQAAIEQKWNTAESQAADLVNQLAKIDGVYIDLSQYKDTTSKFVYNSGYTTNENTVGRQLSPAQQYALEKAIVIFEQIHQKHLAELKSSYYGLWNTQTTDETGRDRNAMLQQAQASSIANAMRVYDAYYGGTGVNP